MDEENKNENSNENDTSGCGCLIFAVIIILVFIMGIPSCSSDEEEKEANLPQAPIWEVTKEQATERSQKIVGEKIKISTGDFLTTTYSIDSVECTAIRQYGERRETVMVELKAYSYYIDGKLSFAKADKYTYNFETSQWDYYPGQWTMQNVEINY